MLGMNHRGKRKRFNNSSDTSNRNLRDRLYVNGPDQAITPPQATTPAEVIQPPPLPTIGSAQPEYVDHVERVKSLERYVADAEQALSSALTQVAQKDQRIANLEAQLSGGAHTAHDPFLSESGSSSPEEVQQAVGALEHYVAEAERLLQASRQAIQEKDRRIEVLEEELENLRQAEDRLRDEHSTLLQQLNESRGQLAEAQQAAAHHQHALSEALAASNAKEERLQSLEVELHQSRTQAETSHRQIEQVRHLQQRLESLLQSHDTAV